MPEMNEAKGGSLPSPKAPSPIPSGPGRLAKNTLLNLFGLGVPLLVGLVSLPFVIRLLGPDRFGIMSLVWVVIGYFSVLDLGLGRATIRFIAEEFGRGGTEQVPKYLWTTVGFQAGLGTAGLIALVLATPWLVGRVLNIPAAFQAEARSAFMVMAFSLPVVMISASFRGVLEAGQRFGLVNAVKVPSSVLNYLLPLAALLLGGGLTEIVILLLASRILVLAVWVVLDFRFYPILRGRPAIHRDKLGPLLAFGGWNTVSSLIAPLLDFVDRFFIGMIRSVHDVGFYAAPYEALWRINILPGSLMTTLFPAFSSLKGGDAKDSIGALFVRALKFLFLVMGTVAVGLILLARPILQIWLGREFAVRSTLVFQLIAAGIWLMSLSFVSFTLLQGIGRADIPAKYHLLEAAVYIPVLGLGIKLWGIKGAAAAWCFRVLLEDGLLFRGVRRLGYAGGRDLARSGLFKAPAALAVFLGLGWALSAVIPAPAAAAAAAVVYAPLAWLWVLSGEERAWFISLARGVRPRRRSSASGEPA